VLWAQSQIVGYELVRRNPDHLAKIAKELQIKEVHEDSHLLEYIVLVQVYNRVNNNDPFFDKVLKAIEKLEGAWQLDDIALRSVAIHVWRFPLQTALYALNMREKFNRLYAPRLHDHRGLRRADH
jgi:hypothetical protein